MGARATYRKELEILNDYRDMLTGENVKKSKDFDTFHHIEKYCYYHETNILKGANLLNYTQKWLHDYIEVTDPELFDLINECLCIYQKCLRGDMTRLVNMYRDEVMPLAKIEVDEFKRRNGYVRIKTPPKKR